MRIIGITGGVGAGKSKILFYLESACRARVIRADEVAHLVMRPGGVCFTRLVGLLGEDVLDSQGQIDRRRMGEQIFKNKELLTSVNSIVHPAVKEYLLEDMAYERQNKRFSWYFLEAALLVEEGYHRICDELWYIYAQEDVRRERLKASRGYSDERISAIMRSQSDDAMFRRYAAHVIDNSGSFEESCQQIDALLQERAQG